MLLITEIFIRKKYDELMGVVSDLKNLVVGLMQELEKLQFEFLPFA